MVDGIHSPPKVSNAVLFCFFFLSNSLRILIIILLISELVFIYTYIIEQGEVRV